MIQPKEKLHYNFETKVNSIIQVRCLSSKSDTEKLVREDAMWSAGFNLDDLDDF